MQIINLRNGLFLVGLTLSLALQAQPVANEPEPAVTLANTITGKDIKGHLTTLASDEYEGRETGTEGQKKAARYIKDHFEELGLKAIGDDNSYYQNIKFERKRWGDVEMEVNGEPYRHLWDFYAFQSLNDEIDELSVDEVIFLGYGIDDKAYSDYKGRNLEGKVIMIYSGEPLKEDSTSWITGTEELSDWSTRFGKKLETAGNYGVAAVLILDRNFQQNLGRYRRFILNPRLQMKEPNKEEDNQYANSAMINSNLAQAIFGRKADKVVKARERISRKGRSKMVRLKTDLTLRMPIEAEEIISENVLGFVEGTDPELKDEVIVLSAHYDHLGVRGEDIWNGANDNASGTSAVLDIIEAFAIAKERGEGPRRSVLALLVTGEEKGLLGSKYYTEHPLIPLENTVVNVNVDMVGRIDAQHADDPDYIYVIGSDRLSTDLHRINEEMNRKYAGLDLDYTYNAEDDPNRYYYRSDHYNFAEKGIPAIFYFNGTHDDYHRPTDVADKINFESLEKVARLIFHTSWELANRDARIKVDVDGTK